jgi:hypothetical protein
LTRELEYLLHLFMLHRLIDLGLDNDLAETIREEMDPVWRSMNVEQVQRLDQVSARLNAKRDIDTAIMTERITELDSIMQHLADAYWKTKL